MYCFPESPEALWDANGRVNIFPTFIQFSESQDINLVCPGEFQKMVILF